MRVLFFFVHPAKYHLFKNSFELLKKKGYHFDIVIANKEVLSNLLINGGYDFVDIFPKGRKIEFLSIKLNAFINLFRTLWRLFIFARKKKYDVFVTDDVLSILGKIKGVPSIAFTDNDLSTVPLVKLIYRTADRIIAPESTNLDDLTSKKISFKGNKALAHLHPKYFKKDVEILSKYNLQNKNIAVVRLSKLNANHDVHGNLGVTDQALIRLIPILSEKYDVIISAERIVADQFKKYCIAIEPIDFTNILAESKLFVGDSSTMAMEAGMLGVPNILINNIAKKLNVLVELKGKYNLLEYFDNYEDAELKIKNLIENPNLQDEYKQRLILYLNNSDDFNQILVDSIVQLTLSN